MLSDVRQMEIRTVESSLLEPSPFDFEIYLKVEKRKSSEIYKILA
jgi:hypothetical protein